MNLRRKLGFALAIWAVGGISLSVAAVNISQYFIAPLAVLSVVIGMYTLNLRCPSCGGHVLLSYVEIGALKIPYVISWLPRKCSNCGKLLS